MFDAGAATEQGDLHMDVPGPQRFQILALDGGGYKGMFSAAVLAAIEEDLNIKLIDHFDLVVGTSTGGLIALGLAAGQAPAELVAFYQAHGAQIFPAHPWNPVRRLFRSKYRPGPLEAALVEILGDRTLGDAACRLVIPTYDLGANAVHIFKTPHHPRLHRDWRARMVDVAMATTAAPTFLPVKSLEGMRLVDGGVWANNPAILGIAEAVSMCGVALTSIRLFSLGTTTDLVNRHRRLDRGGLVQWAGAASDVILQAQSQGSVGTADHMLTPHRHLRLDPTVPPGVLGLDKVVPDILMGHARSESRKILPRFEQIFAGHAALPFRPLYSTSSGGHDAAVG